MAKRKSSGGGSILYGVLAGLLIGLMVAAAVAYYVVKTPSPFVDKASRTPDKAAPAESSVAPDPNAGLGGRTDNTSGVPPVDVPSVSEDSTASSQIPAGKPAETTDDLGALIATLPQASTSSTRPARPSQVNRDAQSKPDVPKAEAPKADNAASGGTYYLQVGSFKAMSDAETMRARIIMLGMTAEIQHAEVNGAQMNRVRVGPFSRLDDMNRVRAKLGEEKIPAVVVRQ